MLTKKKLFIISGLFLVFVLILVLLPKKQPQTNQPPPSLNFQPFFIETPQPETSFKELIAPKERKLVVYQLPPLNQGNIEDFFSPLVAAETSISEGDYLTWSNDAGYLTVNRLTGQFVLKRQPTSTTNSVGINETDALAVAKNWLIQYGLINQEPDYQTTYLEKQGLELEPTEVKSAESYYQFSFLPKLNGYPLFPSNQAYGPIEVIITNQGEVFYVNYQLPALFYSQYLKQPSSLTGNNQALKSDQEINEEIKNNQPVIVLSQLESGAIQTSTEKIKQLSYEKITLGYRANPQNNLIVPVFQLLGKGVLDSGENVTVTAYLPALAE